MILIRITGGLFLVLCGALGGIFLSERLKARAEFMGQYVRFLTQAQAEVGYTASSAEELMKNAAGVPLLRPLLDGTVRYLHKGEELSRAWSRSAESCIKNRRDRELVRSFGESFGTGGVEGELAKLALHRENAQRVYGEYLEEVRAKGRLFRTVGTFCGALAAALLM